MKAIVLIQNTGFFDELSNRFREGGPFFMSLILICLILALAFLLFGFYALKKNPMKSKKMIELASEVSILGLVFGLLGSIIGLIQAFDAIDSLGNISDFKMGSGLKVSFLTTLFGSVTFILPRIGIILYIGMQKSDSRID